jgi:outer membrane protein OmpA-like peptidoglycan-associated protein
MKKFLGAAMAPLALLALTSPAAANQPAEQTVAPLAAPSAAPPVDTTPADTVIDPTVSGQRPQPGPELKGIISARKGDRIQITADDGTRTQVAITSATQMKSRAGLFGGRRADVGATLINGLPVTVRTVQAGDVLVASQIRYRTADRKVAAMIQGGTAQGFAEQSAATEALRGRFADIDQYDVKNTTTVYFDTDKWTLSDSAKAELCATVQAAQQTPNALLLVVGYTDATGPEEYNQQLSERRAGRVVSHVQQACGWKPYRMLTPTGMAEAEPAADNETTEGKARNRRVAVNVLVSKAASGL